MTSRRRWLILCGLLVATVAAAWVEMEQGAGPEAPAAAAGDRRIERVAATGTPRTPALHLDKLKSRNPGESVRDPFAEDARPAARSRERSPRTRAAPPQPFVFAGRLVEADGQTAVFLTNGERNLVVKQGDTIDDTWRVEQVGADAITLLYLPLQQRQAIAASQDSP